MYCGFFNLAETEYLAEMRVCFGSARLDEQTA
jgi:hypothetical protein